jgi:dynein heavy chain
MVIEDMGPQYMDPPTFNLQDCFDDSNPVTPLIFVLSPGADPNQALIAYSDSLGVGRAMLSLGQGQGPIAEKMIGDAVDQVLVKGFQMICYIGDATAGRLT